MPETTTTTPTRKPAFDRRTRRRIVIASLVGTTVEFYDFYAYASAAVAVFPYLFFPANEDHTVALLASFATFGLAFLGRPLGSVLFGHFGDRIGRKATLVASLLTMGIATFLIGILPTYAMAGVLAPALLALMRFCQGLGLGGEWSGAALLATETAEEGKRAWAAMWPQLGAPFGFLAANGLFLILVSTLGHTNGDTTGAFMTWGWRIPFLLSAVMVVIGLYVRFKLEETPVFTRAVQSGKKVNAPVAEVFRTSFRPLVLGTFIMVSCYTLFYLVTTWVLSYGIGPREKGLGLGINYTDFLKIQLISIFAFIVGIVFSGRLADSRGRRRTLSIVSLFMIGFGLVFPLFLSPDTATTGSTLAFLTIGMFIMGLIFGPMSAVLPELFPTNVRYTGSGIAYNLASILGAAIAPFVATALVAAFGVASVGAYLVVVSVISLIAIRCMHETRYVDMTEI
ncbi:MHS family MFS transporter [Corynebacterium sp. CCM 9185]|uniref:MHS family MFS transporter n=1 Tax=Corynebacterium marambiense TaxID=2765364 RepID=A0ABS0VUF0_9CORY|nr:MFS transporter [Corynebacterium marambiense]MBI9000406.1 MHS family MFS transporter [Corynebacterium marambiense]MCK7664159.1 MHS family MFS transporter [Corynebacterium marambiense]MCX7543534.1 MFS transporter [Corynebacterium marambiense]